MVRNDVKERNRIIKAKYNDLSWIGHKFGSLTVLEVVQKEIVGLGLVDVIVEGLVFAIHTNS